MCVCVLGTRSAGLENSKRTQPFGCTPNWLCTVDRMLTEHPAQAGCFVCLGLFFYLLGFVKIFSQRISLLQKNRKAEEACECLSFDKEQSVFLLVEYRKKRTNADDWSTCFLTFMTFECLWIYRTYKDIQNIQMIKSATHQ